VRPVRVPGEVGVVAEDADATVDPLLDQRLLGPPPEVVEDPVTGTLVDDRLQRRRALRRGVLGVRTHIEVQACPVLQEHVGRSAPRDHVTEQSTCDLLGRQAPSPVDGAVDAVLGLEAEDALPHLSRRTVSGAPRASLATLLHIAADELLGVGLQDLVDLVEQSVDVVEERASGRLSRDRTTRRSVRAVGLGATDDPS
jgi:hypothetical protein